ncbi:MAG: pilus assembly protein [Eubacteriales bacterium]|nr:pilus assembly protein [Eubacteriales bacterium]MDD4476439.1 pilus assembly protein [Eubacteriales bacterium]
MKFFKDESGQAVVELAIVTPILLLILCGIIDFAWIFSAQLATDNCAREGTRYASVVTSYSTAEYDTARRVSKVAADSIKENISTKVTYSTPENPSAGDVTVEVVSEVKALTFVANTIFGDTVKLKSKLTMKVG